MLAILGYILVALGIITSGCIIMLIVCYICSTKEAFHRIRKDYPNLSTYEIRLTEGMFGAPYCKDPVCTLKASSPEHAMERFLVWHDRTRRYHHQAWNSSGEVYETTCSWGTVAITCLETRFTSYFH